MHVQSSEKVVNHLHPNLETIGEAPTVIQYEPSQKEPSSFYHYQNSIFLWFLALIHISHTNCSFSKLF
jgi:hypothetical protein